MTLIFKQEFQFKNFKLNYKPVNDFFESPWFPAPVVIFYRVVLALYSVVWILYRAIGEKIFTETKRFFQATYWGYFSLILYFVISSSVTIYEYVKIRNRDAKRGSKERDVEARWIDKIQWCFYSIATTMSIGVSLFFFLFDWDQSKGIDLSDVNVHILNSVFMLLDHFLSSMPVRIFHMIYPMIYVCLYMISTVIYWAFIDKTPIYGLMDYNNNPGVGIGLLLAAMWIAAPVIHMFYYGTYRLREYLSHKKNKVNSGNDEEMNERRREDAEIGSGQK